MFSIRTAPTFCVFLRLKHVDFEETAGKIKKTTLSTQSTAPYARQPSAQ